MAQTRILLVRHGQTSWNLGAGQVRYRGQTDIPLDEVGHAQAHALADRLADEPIAGIYTSPLSRAVQTAQPTAEQHGLPVVPHPGLLDMHLGEWQGLTHTSCTPLSGDSPPMAGSATHRHLARRREPGCRLGTGPSGCHGTDRPPRRPDGHVGGTSGC